MDNLIDRDEVLYEFVKVFPEGNSIEWYKQAKPDEFKDLIDTMYGIVLGANRINAKPVKRGKWKCVSDDENIWRCTNCTTEISLKTGNPVELEWRFCPYCSAYMGGKKDYYGTRQYVVDL